MANNILNDKNYKNASQGVKTIANLVNKGYLDADKKNQQTNLYYSGWIDDNPKRQPVAGIKNGKIAMNPKTKNWYKDTGIFKWLDKSVKAINEFKHPKGMVKSLNVDIENRVIDHDAKQKENQTAKGRKLDINESYEENGYGKNIYDDYSDAPQGYDPGKGADLSMADFEQTPQPGDDPDNTQNKLQAKNSLPKANTSKIKNTQNKLQAKHDPGLEA